MIDLAAWHAEPLPEGEAQIRLDQIRTATTWDDRLEVLRLRIMLGLPFEMQRDVLWNEASSDMQRAAVELITGQIMLARRLQGAWIWLDTAQQRLAHHLPGTGYLELLRRHATLRGLRLFDTPKPIRPLTELLTIARMTAQLEGRQRKTFTLDARDTLG
ncbi:MAG: hypothetical protein B7Y40_01890 [Gammaproteobacteria bacterium 28-57-27]|nr:MAG: hypothetical protein B7Y40_01890 [Gammaproteobacteria bacterium 28-57-27]